MKWPRLLATIAIVGMVACLAQAQDSSKRKVIEIYRIAPGQHVAFLKMIKLLDEANRIAGVPPRDLYVHSDGASWDFLLIQPAELTPEQSKAVDAAMKKLGAPQGAHFFTEFRALLAEHTDTFVEGPTTAAEWLKKLE